MQWQRLFFKGRLSASDKSLRKKDFVKTAQADGFGFAKRLDAKHDVPRLLDEFIHHRGPAFLEVIIDPTAGVYPMVGPGLSYHEMITGDFIPNRYANLGKPPPPDTSEMF
jgi:acetolactate synthase-1/2/3 large subunit